ncbi:MAG: tryptophan synthase subunit alpha [Candidatus Omnitrophota bacterium]
MNRIEKKFKELKKNKKKAFIVFITAGYPDLNTTYKLILEFSRIGVDIIELGVPFTDPMADGPVIQESSQAALAKKTNLVDIFNLVKRLRHKSDIPICLMTYYNPVFCFGEDRFVKSAKGAGVDGVIVPDLPVEEAKSLIRLAKIDNLDTIFFVSPTSTLKRIKVITKAACGFIYYVSLTGVTGVVGKLPKGLAANIKTIKNNTSKPVCVGFGISTPKQVKEISLFSDGVIIGSAIVGKIKENIGKPDLVKKVGNFVTFLKG